jgi:hypothetical protein
MKTLGIGYVNVCVFVYVCMHVCMMYVCMMYVCMMYVCMYICMYVLKEFKFKTKNTDVNRPY